MKSNYARNIINKIKDYLMSKVKSNVMSIIINK